MTDKLACHWFRVLHRSTHTVLHKICDVFCLCLGAHIAKILPAGGYFSFKNHDVGLVQTYLTSLAFTDVTEKVRKGQRMHASMASATLYFIRKYFSQFVCNAWEHSVNDLCYAFSEYILWRSSMCIYKRSSAHRIDFIKNR